MSRSLVTRLMAASSVVRGGSPTGPNPLAQRPPGDRRPLVLVSLFLADGRALERAAAQAMRFPRLRMVVATDSTRIVGLRAAGAVVEHFPSAAEVRGFPAAGDWATYLRRRWQLVLTKWEPTLLREGSASFGRYLEVCGLAHSRHMRELEQSNVLAAEVS